MTYSNTYWGEHTTSVDGNGKNPETKELLSVGVRAGLKKIDARILLKKYTKRWKKICVIIFDISSYKILYMVKSVCKKTYIRVHFWKDLNRRILMKI